MLVEVFCVNIFALCTLSHARGFECICQFSDMFVLLCAFVRMVYENY